MSQAAELSRPGVARRGERLRGALERLVFGSAVYRMLLLGSVPTGLLLSPPASHGDAQRGTAILRGELLLVGERGAAADLWTAPASEAWQAAAHAFEWLADLRAEGSPMARERARALIAGWIQQHGDWSPLAWRGDVLGRRLIMWLAEHEFFAADAEEDFRAIFMRSLARQARHLDRVARLGGAALGPPGHGRISALVALVHAAACLPGAKDRLAKALVLLLREVDRQVLPDGGHYQRSPALQLALLREMVGLRRVLIAGRHAVPSRLQGAIDRMAPILRFFRHGDGRLALFNGTNEGIAAEIDGVLALTDAAGKPPPGAPHTGFQRMETGRALVIADTGPPAAPESDTYAHAGTLSFELSYGKERLVVNCGTRPHARAEWLVAQRATAAHSTLVLDDANSSEVLPSGRLGRRPRHVLCRRDDVEGAMLVDVSHDGYAPPFGVLHRRRLYLPAEGEDLRGEDRLVRVRPGEPRPFTLRFHLHPDVQVSLVHDGKAALVRLPSGAGFRFDAAGGRLALEESIYLGAEAGARRSEQIVVASTLAGDEALVKWSFKRLGGEG
jgi:uncharacterized heparinase superfamily protein